MLRAKPAAGFAVVDNTTGEIDVKSIQDTERGAMVNWLWTTGRFHANDATTEAQIRAQFWKHELTHSVVPVTITRADGDGN